MNDLVFLKNEKAMTDSLKVAEMFRERHDHVIRGIRLLLHELATTEINSSNESPVFVETSYTHAQNGQRYPKYNMNFYGLECLIVRHRSRFPLTNETVQYLSTCCAMQGARKKEQCLDMKDHSRINAMNSLVEIAYRKSCSGDWSALEDIKVLNTESSNFIYQAVLETIICNLLACRAKEADVYDWFRSNYKSVLNPSFTIVKRENDQRHIPDFWLRIGGEDIPVECKLHDFGRSALNQLKRYMDFYHCRHGIAVGADCKCDLPNNIVFIQHGVM